MEPENRVEVTEVPAPATPPRGVAPAWHTVLFLAIFAGLSLGGSTRLANAGTHAHWPIYIETIVMQWLLVLFVWWGLRMRGRRMRDLIGGRWDTLEAALTDVGIAIGFFFANMLIRAMIAAVILLVKPNVKAMSMEGMKHVAQVIGPKSVWELVLFMGVAVTAGICEEIMFRGYLQQQLMQWTRSTAMGVVLSALLFALGHLYQGAFLATQVGLLGLMLGILAAWRKSLRPGMIAHGAQDVISGLLTRLLFSGK